MSMSAGSSDGLSAVTVREAAQHLGISEGAVRHRIRRGTLESSKDQMGRTSVVLPVSGEVSSGSSTDNPEALAAYKRLIESQAETILDLRAQNERKDVIISQLVGERLALPAPQVEERKRWWKRKRP